ncbi:DUF3800 domain-containing protein [Curtobacterium sp. ISL-83]|uniref:DUF3800 domain-containing protein n=1 Tax=Curtobacterium sp. ISL-83 TaxID=2819145 RepID=UPI001BE6BB2D|nr:DUF3800 domain-containing protein [Curtobacterium sp. ISL-83]MBT2501788.1 DUF3800 domain-containing protein [Curtobacterium sp. ISL-83]
MLLCFVDESFKDDLYGFGAIVADADQTHWLTQRLHEVVAPLAAFGIDGRTEIHAHPIFHGKGRWDAVPPRARVKVFIDVVDAVRAAGATVLLRAVPPAALARYQETRALPDRFPPEQVAFQHLLQRLDQLAATRATRALVIADERDDRERHRERFALYQTYGTPGPYMRTRLDRLLDTVHFAPSHHSRMLQAADVLAYVWVRARTVVETDPRQARVMEALVGEIERMAYRPGVWP